MWDLFSSFFFSPVSRFFSFLGWFRWRKKALVPLVNQNMIEGVKSLFYWHFAGRFSLMTLTKKTFFFFVFAFLRPFNLSSSVIDYWRKSLENKNSFDFRSSCCFLVSILWKTIKDTIVPWFSLKRKRKYRSLLSSITSNRSPLAFLQLLCRRLCSLSCERT